MFLFFCASGFSLGFSVLLFSPQKSTVPLDTKSNLIRDTILRWNIRLIKSNSASVLHVPIVHADD